MRPGLMRMRPGLMRMRPGLMRMRPGCSACRSRCGSSDEVDQCPLRSLGRDLGTVVIHL